MNRVDPRAAANRLAAAFFFTHDLFRRPGEEQWKFLNSGRAAQIYAELSSMLDLSEEMALADSASDFENEFKIAFDAEGGEPTVPLQESHYNRRHPASRIQDENLLFYRTFGLRPREIQDESFDHLRHQLEFAGWLWRLESAALATAGSEDNLEQIRTARHEYLTRHLLSWLPAAVSAAEESGLEWVEQFLRLALELVRVCLSPSN